MWLAEWEESCKRGLTLGYLGKLDADRKMCSLFLSRMDRMDIKLDHFGDSYTRMADV